MSDKPKNWETMSDYEKGEWSTMNQPMIPWKPAPAKGGECELCWKHCNKIGQINRFNKKKTFCCNHYFWSRHRQINNPDFDKKKYCNPCLRVLDKIKNNVVSK